VQGIRVDEQIKIVVAEGAEDRGLLRFVLEGEGFEVVAEVTNGAELVRVAEAEQPDVVVLDEAIGSNAISMTRAVSPSAKVVLVSNEERAEAGVDGWVAQPLVVRNLGIAVLRACAIEPTARPSATTETFVRPEWVDRVRKDPATLRGMLAGTGDRPVAERPSITAMQRRAASRSHPSAPGDRGDPLPDAGAAVASGGAPRNARAAERSGPSRRHAHPHKR
jgi:two-component system, chemotaxis family, chemotaxis protein CheY